MRDGNTSNSRRPTARPGLRCHAEVETAPGGLRPELLPAPEADEVVAVRPKEVEVGVVVVLLRWVNAIVPRT